MLRLRLRQSIWRAPARRKSKSGLKLRTGITHWISLLMESGTPTASLRIAKRRFLKQSLPFWHPLPLRMPSGTRFRLVGTAIHWPPLLERSRKLYYGIPEGIQEQALTYFDEELLSVYEEWVSVYKKQNSITKRKACGSYKLIWWLCPQKLTGSSIVRDNNQNGSLP